MCYYFRFFLFIYILYPYFQFYCDTKSPILVVIDMQNHFEAARDQGTIGQVKEQIRDSIQKNQTILLVQYANYGPVLDELIDIIKEKNYTNYEILTKKYDDGSKTILNYIQSNKLEPEFIEVCGINICLCVKETVDNLAATLPNTSFVVLKPKATNCACSTSCTLNLSKSIKTLLQIPNIFLSEKDSKTSPLIKAIQNGKFEDVKNLLDSGENINQTRNDGATPLYIASQYGHIDIVNLLLQKGVDVNQLMPNKSTALFVAAQNGHLPVVNQLLLAGAHGDDMRTDGITPLFMASNNGHNEVVQHLILNGSDVNHMCPFSFTPLHVAAEKGHLKVIDTLLKHGAGVCLKTKCKTSPLSLAAKRGQFETVKKLLVDKFSFDDENERGNTPLCEASFRGHLEVMTILIDNGANINALCSPLSMAIENRQIDAIKLLIKNHVNLSAQNFKKEIPLGIAIKKGDVDIVKMLIEEGADVNQKDSTQNVPLSNAIVYKRDDLIEILLNAKADVNQTVFQFQLPVLHMASVMCNLQTLELFLKQPGANLTTKFQGKDLEEWARSRGEAENADLIRKYTVTTSTQDSGATIKI